MERKSRDEADRPTEPSTREGDTGRTSFHRDTSSAETRLSDPRRLDRAWPIPTQRPERSRESGSGPRSLVPTFDPGSLESVLAQVKSLATSLGLAETESQLLQIFVDALVGLLPSRAITVRLLENDSLGLVHATTPLRASRDAIHVSRAAMLRAGDEVKPTIELLAHEGRVTIGDEHEVLSTHAERGFDLCLAHGDALLGVVAVEGNSRVDSAAERPLVELLTRELVHALLALRALREADFLREYVAQVFEHADAPIVALALDGEIRGANRAALALAQLERDIVIGQNIEQIIGGEPSRARIRDVIAAAVEGRASANVDLRLPGERGRVTRIMWNAAPIFDERGDVGAIIAIGRDVSDVHRLETQIIHAEKLATLGQLAAGIVHELNNPLTSISVYGEYLLTKTQRAGGEPQDVEKLRRIVDAAARMSRFTRDLVNYARPSIGETEPVRIVDVIDESIGFCEHLLERTHVAVRRSFARDLPEMEGVRGQLHQVFVNLLTNACQALEAAPPSGDVSSVDVDVHLRRASAGDARIVVIVRDNGPGIPAEHLHQVFEPFFSTKGEGKGTGLGLSIVRNIVTQHGATISVESSAVKAHAGGEVEGRRGTTFMLEFPVGTTRG